MTCVSRFALAIAAMVAVTAPPSRSAPLPQTAQLTAADAERQLAALRAERANATPTLAWNTDGKILRLLVEHFPGRAAEIGETIARLGEDPTTPASLRVSTFALAIQPALNKKLGLPAIERVMSRAVAAMTRDEVAASERANAPNGQRLPPTEADIDAKYYAIRVQALEVLGRVHLDLDQMDKAEAELREVLRLNPALTNAHSALAEIERGRRNDRAALDHYLVVKALGGSLTADADSRMKELYRKVHNGSDAGMADEAERVYVAAMPNPIAASKYAPPATPSGRVALVELFTGSGCFPCVPADLAFDALVDRYSAGRPQAGIIAALAYHLHAPEPDPMALPAGSARLTLLNAGPSGVPRFYVNGVPGRIGGGSRLYANALFEDYRATIDRALGEAPGARLTVRAALTGDRISVTTTVSGAPGAARDLRLHVVLAEQQLHFHGENGVHAHAMVVRAVAGDLATGLPIVRADSGTTVESTFDLTSIASEVSTYLDSTIASRRSKASPSAPPQVYRAEGHALTAIDPAALVVVAYVSGPDRRVLQAATADVRR